MTTHTSSNHPGSKRHPLTLCIRTLAIAGISLGTASAQNLVTNSDFSANIGSFNTWPGYFGGANPGSAPNWTTGGGTGLNGTLAPLNGQGSPFAPANNVPSFLLMQGDTTASQAVNTVGGTDYLFSFDGAARNGNIAGVSVFADNTQAASVVIDASLGWLPQSAFQRAAFGFTATGAQTIQFNSSGIDDHTTDITNVSVTAAAIPGVWDVGSNVAFFTETSGTRNYGFALTGSNQTIVRRPGSATYTGNITTAPLLMEPERLSSSSNGTYGHQYVTVQ